MRDCITAHEKLVVTLRYLSLGASYKNIRCMVQKVYKKYSYIKIHISAGTPCYATPLISTVDQLNADFMTNVIVLPGFNSCSLCHTGMKQLTAYSTPCQSTYVIKHVMLLSNSFDR